MELKTARLTLLIDPNKKAAFEHLCAQQDRSASQVVRQLIRDYLARHGVEYTAAGPEPAPAPQPSRAAATRSKPKVAGLAASASAARPGPRRR